MKIFLMLAFVAFFAAPACAQRKSPHDTVTTSNIKLTYGRPYKKDRVVFGGLEKYGEVWRTGADEATMITFAKDGTFGGKPVKAGSYSLFSIPGEQEWTVILNSEVGQWGTRYNKDKDVLQVKVPSKKLDSVVEQHTMRFTDSDLIIEWDKTQVAVPVNFK